MRTTTTDVDVLVCGAGPVGLTGALLLARAGLSVRLVDAAEGPAVTSRALANHARTLEIYDELGLLDDISPYGTCVHAFVRHDDGSTRRLDYDFGDLVTRFRYVLMTEQVVVERALRGHCARAGVDVEWGTSLEDFHEEDDGVTALLRGPGAGADPESVHARYLWGCDGGHSRVRKRLGLPLEGESSQTWLFADAAVDTDIDRDALHWIAVPGAAPVMMFPFPQPGRWRLLDTGGLGDPDRPDMVARQFADKLGRGLGRAVEVTPPTWTSRFTVQQRAVPTMRAGRCFVSGDAAHVHSPASGQGMNTGIQDAYNLAWKLSMVVRGEADDALLDTYSAERVPIGQALLRSTAEVNDKATTGRGSESGRDFSTRLTRSMSGLAIDYGPSPLVLADDRTDDTSAGPRPGERVARLDGATASTPAGLALRERLRGTRWLLVDFSEGHLPPATDAGIPGMRARAWIDVHRVEIGPGPDATDGARALADALGAVGGDWLLVRPDGHLAARGRAPDRTPDEALAGLAGAGLLMRGTVPA